MRCVLRLTMKMDSTRPLQIQQVMEVLEDVAVGLVAETVVAVGPKAEVAPTAHASPSKAVQVTSLIRPDMVAVQRAADGCSYSEDIGPLLDGVVLVDIAYGDNGKVYC